MKVRPGAVSGGADSADLLSGLHLLSDADIEAGEVRVSGFKTVAMIDQNTDAVSTVPTGLHNPAVGIGINGVTMVGGDIQTIMESSLTGNWVNPVTVQTGDSFPLASP